ncbi:MAG TPA: hypothetical protein VH478_04240, partial [Trebonia sp.]|nr:hypothetical protein [Trebonia sp.]
TAEDIRSGRPGEAWRCPVALAAARATGASTDDEDVLVSRTFITVTWPGTLVPGTYGMPPEARLFVDLFDGGTAGDDLAPFTFTATLEDEATS